MVAAPPSAALADPTGGLAAGTSLLAAGPALVGQPVKFTGRLDDSRDSLVEVQMRDRGGSWRRFAIARSDMSGAFATSWKTRQAGVFRARAVPASGSSPARIAAAPATVVTVYRSATATWYDLSGRTSACGIRLRRATIGVAHRTLRCGSRVAVSYRGRTLSVPVVDRGPSVRGVAYDLTVAAAARLGLVRRGRVRVGVLPQSERTPKLLPAAMPPSLDVTGGLTLPTG